ncbi:MAG: DUF4260 domain-containing protein [Chloroflexi bacterium]|nr:DUF4260 domain-containing protein [Chloroflexota bacterium]
MNRSLFGLTPSLLLRLESLALLTGVLAVYSRIAPDWGLFALLLLVPDLSMAGYLRGKRLGSLLYNVGHTLSLSLLVVAVGLATSSALTVQIGLIWTAHIAVDRVLGYGLKYTTDFKDTHLQRV